MSTEPAVAPTGAPVEDFMPLHGIDHVELWVGNAQQAAYFYRHALGFKEVAYAGLETGVRDRTSHVLEQGRIRIVLTGALTPDHEIGTHQAKHGDGMKVIALSVPDVAHAGLQARVGDLAEPERARVEVRRLQRVAHVELDVVDTVERHRVVLGDGGRGAGCGVRGHGLNDSALHVT